MIVALIITAVLLSIISGFAKAVCDLSEEGKLKFNPENYWLKSKSWRSKYKQNNPILGAKFLGSTTVFVALTDAWHLFNLVQYYSTVGAFIFVGYLIAAGSKCHLLLLLLVPLQRVVFHIFYTYKILKK